MSQNFLCHTSHKRSEHDKLAKLIARFVSTFEDQLERMEGRAKNLVHWAHDELKKTHPDLPALGEIVDDIIDRLPRRKIRVVNSEGKSGEDVRGAPNFIVGGNIVGRGLTIPNLLVTYYLRKPKISQMDTMLQHARMFGYRKALMPYTRVFLPRSLAVRFNGIHEAEAQLRQLLPTIDSIGQIPVQVVGNLRPTRYGVLDTGSVVAIGSGEHLYVREPNFRMPRGRDEQLEKMLCEIFGAEWDINKKLQPMEVPMEKLLELLEVVRVDEWDNPALRSIIQSIVPGDRPRGYIAYRPMSRGRSRSSDNPYLPTGALSGEELREARARDLPTFFMFRQMLEVPCWDNRRFWYPTVVFPGSMPTQVYNDTEIAES